ncbi:c-type cytochrome [Flavitalea sp. BT771]|uniref:c-type cytochrome n=1 Tax=Flavitalea sp. BT771 TaxID=3063329 RepID=UPI0026E2CB1F|nr:cytochrome c [Flavitalea sp. BT771]MDO6430859.1 c-type cytochrome [Flavitalea sp. BT771]MDV6219001.1 c-type cytochrome [Flavitalea sp. BT771]
MKPILFFIVAACIGLVAAQCKSKQAEPGAPESAGKPRVVKGAGDTVIVFMGINSKGVGRFDHVQLTHPLDDKMIASGRAIYQTKCFACHKLTTEMLVGPGWAGVTNRRRPAWIMNWITNTKVMLDKDLAAQADLAVCLIRMPDQDLTDSQARDVLEFMRQNDGKK